MSDTPAPVYTTEQVRAIREKYDSEIETLRAVLEIHQSYINRDIEGQIFQALVEAGLETDDD